VFGPPRDEPSIAVDLIMICPQKEFGDLDHELFAEIHMSQTTHDIVVMFREKV
jgi:hypothetical protein